MNEYIPTIGIEVHVELKTKTKVFSDSLNDYSAPANTLINVYDLGYPGVLPKVNKEVINKALKSALALNCNINKKMHFDRKNYFYADLPKGYQITQSRTPIGFDGYLEIIDDGKIKRIDIERIHIEEDTCKSIHKNGITYLNYNRAGVPLVEIVTKPVIKSANEAMKYLETLRELLFYLGVSDCKMEEGSMRADINISLSNNNTLGTKVEIKNLGSISNCGIAIDYEIKRQKRLLTSSNKIIEETRKFDSKTKSTVSMRVKEIGNDYRYFPEPDIPYIYIDNKTIEKVKSSLIFLPNERRNIYKSKLIPDKNIEKLIANKELSDFLNKYLDYEMNFKIASNILLEDITSYLNKKSISINQTNLDQKFYNLVTKLDDGSISSKIFKEILKDILESDLSIDDILKSKNITLVNDTEELEKIILHVLDLNNDSVISYKNGKENAFKYLMGMIMKETKGNANPKIVNEILKELLSKDVN